MRKPIAMIKINAGNPGWYDPLTNIHLTISRPTAYVYEGSNVSNIKNAIKHRLINVIEGDIEFNKPVVCSVIEEDDNKESVREVVPKQQVEKVEEKIEEITIEPVVIEKTTEINEEVIEESITEEKIEEEKPKKKTTRKSTTKKTTTKK